MTFCRNIYVKLLAFIFEQPSYCSKVAMGSRFFKRLSNIRITTCSKSVVMLLLVLVVHMCVRACVHPSMRMVCAFLVFGFALVALSSLAIT